ncbi:HAMP domain-containing histidine kinase [Clostridium estertheticum]|uniref:sensor histidine kinase n=1 Tax=Clostridium estertheticum TaxID=238834 RepID=UPI001CD0707D|nr:HAMP domain-containing sensor histidine kinase [Clostridium estertheticum]MBZ9689508.1 HAMP domain-containing histidine kinase [Clostridium estertheticum]
MKKHGITLKLFTITVVFLFMFISAVILIQSLFFEKFYVTQKTKELKTNVEKFKANYNNYTPNNIFNAMSDFEDKNNAKIAILENNGTLKLIQQPLVKEKQSRDSETMMLAINNWISSLENYFDVLSTKKTIVYTFKHPSLYTDNLVLVSPVLANGEIKDIVFVLSTLQPVGEAASITRKYYIYVYIAAVILIAILSLIYSKMISKPLISLNSTASKIAELDFSAKCPVNSNDEIGSLGKTLNFLSEKLGITLNELKTANENLKGDIEKEKQLEKMRKEFIASVSHELKSPISVISGFAEGLKDGIPKGDDITYYLDVIIDESKNMNSLVCDMLDLSQLESGNFKLNMLGFNITQFINSIYKKFQNSINDKHLKLNISDDMSNVVVYGDPYRIEQVINNLISNAIRYTPHNKTITIALKAQENSILIQIENEGSFIEKVDLDRIWDKFYKVDKSGNKHLGGTGLGLSIVKNILYLHKSNFGVLNTDAGVCFYFTLAIIEP